MYIYFIVFFFLIILPIINFLFFKYKKNEFFINLKDSISIFFSFLFDYIYMVYILSKRFYIK